MIAIWLCNTLDGVAEFFHVVICHQADQVANILDVEIKIERVDSESDK